MPRFGPVAALWGDERSRYFRFRHEGFQTILILWPLINIIFDQFFFLGSTLDLSGSGQVGDFDGCMRMDGLRGRG